MRPHGRATVDARHPRAFAICDRCGSLYNHDTLSQQWDWRGAKLQDLRILVCSSCYDKPQEGLRTIVLPADPVPVKNPRTEFDISNDNPISDLGSTIGTITRGGGLAAAFDGNYYKRFFLCAYLPVSRVGFGNTVGKNWAGTTTGAPSSLIPTAPTHVVSSFTAYAPADLPFLNSGAASYKFSGSNDGVTFTDLSTGTTQGTVGEVLTVTALAGTAYQFHQLNFSGNGTSLAVAQLVINVSA